MSFIRAEPEGFRTERLTPPGNGIGTTCLFDVYIVTPAPVLYGKGGGNEAVAGDDHIEFLLFVVKRGYIHR